MKNPSHIIIVPRPDHPFKIKNVRAMNGRHIQFSLSNKGEVGRFMN
jgi:hypothetical protein